MAYTDPTAATLKADFPEFSSTDDATVTRAINVAKRMVDQSWTEGDYTRAIELYACHLMSTGQVASPSGGGGGGGAGGGGAMTGAITSESLGPISVSYGEAKASGGGGSGGYEDIFGLSATTYGSEFLMLQRLNRGGPRTTGQLWGGVYPFRIYGGNDEGL